MASADLIYYPAVWQSAALPERMQPAEGADLWKVNVKEVYALVAAHRHLLTREEGERGSRFRRLEDASRFFTSRVVLKLLLAAYTGVAAEEIHIRRTAGGKPEADYPVAFNYSHSGSYVLFAFSRQQSGVDIEQMQEQFDYAPVAAQTFHPFELAYMQAGEDMRKRFYQLWTRKEAYLKMKGRGLDDQLSQLHTLRRSSIVSFDVDTEHTGALALEEGAAVTVVCRELVHP